MVDTGCSVTLISAAAARGKCGDNVALRLELLDGVTAESDKAVRLVSLMTVEGVELGPVCAHVRPSLPLSVDLVLGLDVIVPKGLTVTAGIGKDQVLVRVGKMDVGLSAVEAKKTAPMLKLQDSDFEATFEDGKWVASWKWKEGEQAADELGRLVRNYSIAKEDREALDQEISEWVEQGILVKHDEQDARESEAVLANDGSETSKRGKV